MSVEAPRLNEFRIASDSVVPQVAAELLPIVYNELRSLAAHYLNSERPDHTLQPTALVHEAYVRLEAHGKVTWNNREEFIYLAAVVMRRVLVDHARARRAAKRGGSATRVTLDGSAALSQPAEIDLLGLDDVLDKLAKLNERHSRVVELRFFGGLTVEETARVLHVSTRTVEADWGMARVWLRRQIDLAGAA